MLFAQIKSNGDLVVRATEEIEEYALKQWEKAHKTGDVKLIIETGNVLNLTEVIQSLGQDIGEFQKWYQEQKNKALVKEK